MLFPFLDMVRAHSAQPLFLTTAAIAFFFGASFPDIDVAFYAKGHRSRSPLHNLSTAGALYALSVLLCLWLKDGLPNFQIASLSFNLFMFGWVCHLCGDMIQGGCGYIPGRSKKSDLQNLPGTYMTELSRENSLRSHSGAWRWRCWSA